MATATPYDRDETNDDGEAKLLGQALAQLRGAKGFSQAEAGAAFGETGLSSQGWGLYEAGKRPGIFRPAVQKKLLAAIGATYEEWMEDRAKLAGFQQARRTPEPRTYLPKDTGGQLTIRDKVQAGSFLAADDLSQEEPKPYPAVRDGRYPKADQWLSQVIGDSINLLGIVEGDLVHCVSAQDIGYQPRTNDIVEVERLRYGGGMRELTVKQVEVTPDGILLWPRSTNQRFTDPLVLDADTRPDEEFEVRIRGLVIGSLRRY